MSRAQLITQETSYDFLSSLKQVVAAEAPARAKVLSAALKVLRKKDLSQCTVADLLTTGNVSRGSFYQYFQNKYDVADVLFRHIQQLTIERTKAVSTGERDQITRIRNTFNVYLEMQVSLGWLHAMLLSEAKRPESPLSTARLELMDTMTKLIAHTVKSLSDRDLDPDVYRALIMTLEELTLHVHRGGKFSAKDAAHISNIMIPIVQRTLAIEGDALLLLPKR